MVLKLTDARVFSVSAQNTMSNEDIIKHLKATWRR